MKGCSIDQESTLELICIRVINWGHELATSGRRPVDIRTLDSDPLEISPPSSPPFQDLPHPLDYIGLVPPSEASMALQRFGCLPMAQPDH